MNTLNWASLLQENFSNSPKDWSNYNGRCLPKAVVPVISTKETETAYRIEWLVFGLTADELQVSIENPLLTIAARKNTDANLHTETYLEFSESYIPPANTNWAAIVVTIEEGRVEVVMPKYQIVRSTF
ncbi:MAG: Hsp20 family protein [Bacteroidia bacterium]